MVESNESSGGSKTVTSMLKAGFEVTTRHWAILIVPILLDCLFWLGPRFRFAGIVRTELETVINQTPSDFSGFQPEALEQFYSLIERSNLLTALSVPLLGVPALLSGITQEQTPFFASNIEIETPTQVILYFLVFSLAGFFLSGVYYYQVTRAVAIERSEDFGNDAFRKIIQLFILGIVLLLLITLLMLPIIFVATFVGLISLGLAYAVLIGGLIVIIWAVILTSFSAHALMIDGKTPFYAIPHSVRFVRKNLGMALPLLLIVLVTSSLVENVMLSADSGSWLTVFSIGGHAFIVTAFLAATLIFYKETTSVQNSALKT